MKEKLVHEVFSYKRLRLAYARLIKTSTLDVKNFYGGEIYDIELRKNIKTLHSLILNDKYEPQRPFKYFEPKPSNTERIKTVLSIDDSLVYMAITTHIAEKLFDELSKTQNFVFGNLLHENIKLGIGILDDLDKTFDLYKNYIPLYNNFINSGIEEVESKQQDYKLDTDITGFFDSIPHGSLMLLLSDYGVDEEVLELLGNCLNTWSGTSEKITPFVGIPQGPSASFFYSNVILHHLDKRMIELGASYYRYADDIKVYSASKAELYDSLSIIDRYLKSHGLSINSSKTNLERTNVDLELERAKILNHISLSRIELSPSEMAMVGSEYSTTTESDDYFYMKLDSAESIKIIETRLLAIEEKIFTTFIEYSAASINDKAVEKNVLKDAYEWRYFARILTENYSYIRIVNETLPEIWLIYLEKYFYRAQHFSSNLAHIPLNSLYVKKIYELKKKYKRFEWVTYHLNRSLEATCKLEGYQFRKKIFQELENHNSALVRLSLYQLLLKALQEEDQLHDSVMHKIQADKEPFIKFTLLDYVVAQKRIDSSFAVNWFE